VYSLRNAGGHDLVARNLPGVDDVVRTDEGHIMVTLPTPGRLYDVTAGQDVARGLRNPQGLEFDAAQNLLVTESDNGRVDEVVRSFAVTTPGPDVQLAPGQAICFGLIRAPGFTDPVSVDQVTNVTAILEPTGGAPGELLVKPCGQPSCTVDMTLRSGAKVVHAWITYRD
jgi:hypothetical protein